MISLLDVLVVQHGTTDPSTAVSYSSGSSAYVPNAPVALAAYTVEAWIKPATISAVVNPAIDKSGLFAFWFDGCIDCNQIRAIVAKLDVSPSSFNPIPDNSVLYTCTVLIDPLAPAGEYAVEISNVVATMPNTLPAYASGRGGLITVTNPNPPP